MPAPYYPTLNPERRERFSLPEGWAAIFPCGGLIEPLPARGEEP
ncbi:MAG: hypothetical protein P1P84_18625 [Deferrisomatales bacterium]|nr:hypothetical protein [Deferrisomatales bacterium]